MCHYLDDFLKVFNSHTPLLLANKIVDWIQSLGIRLGLAFQDEKTIRPTHIYEFLELLIDTVMMETQMPDDKLNFLRESLSKWSQKRTCSLCELQSLIGFLQFSLLL